MHAQIWIGRTYDGWVRYQPFTDKDSGRALASWSARIAVGMPLLPPLILVCAALYTARGVRGDDGVAACTVSNLSWVRLILSSYSFESLMHLLL